LDLVFDSEQPLANRRIRFWPWPFGLQSSGIPLDARAAQSPRGQRAVQESAQEELRLLYVGLTRARDRLVLAWDAAVPATWLDELKAPWLKPNGATLALPDRGSIPADHIKITPPTSIPAGAPAETYAWFPRAQAQHCQAPRKAGPLASSPSAAIQDPAGH
jgi:hypothetical protein